VRPSLSIIKTTGPFFAVALIVAVLLRSGAEPDRHLVPDPPPDGRFGAAVLQDGAVTKLEGDVSFSLSADASPVGTSIEGAADARFLPTGSMRSSSQASDSLARPSETDAANATGAAGAPPPPSSASPRFQIRLQARLQPGDTFAAGDSDDVNARVRVRYFPEGLCSVPFEWERGSLSAVRRSEEDVRGRVRGTFRRVDVYRPDAAVGCGPGPLVPDDPTETVALDLRFEALAERE
jgi:hypothetical protein